MVARCLDLKFDRFQTVACDSPLSLLFPLPTMSPRLFSLHGTPAAPSLESPVTMYCRVCSTTLPGAIKLDIMIAIAQIAYRHLQRRRRSNPIIWYGLWNGHLIAIRRQTCVVSCRYPVVI